jgi:RNA polymerase sigma-70 factor (ECF subfamily)
MHTTHRLQNFKMIWDDFSGKVRSFVNARISDRSSVDDIVQEIFLKIHNNIENLTDESKLSTWIFTIARNTIIDFYRSQKIGQAPLQEDIAGEDDACDSIGLYDLVLSIPEKYSQALLLTEFDGLSYQDASANLGISVSGVKSRVQRGRNMIRDSLLRCCHFIFDKYGMIIDTQPAVCCCCYQNCIQ